MSINVEDVVAQFGAFYKPGSDNQKNLRNMIYKPKETASFFQNRPSDDTIFRSNMAALTRVVQPFQKTFTPIGALTFKPNQFDLFQMKIDVQEAPDALVKTYVGFLGDIAEIDRSKWPFVRWFLEQHIMPKADEDLETLEYFAGVFAAPEEGVAGAAGTSMDGIRKVIRGYATAGRTNVGNGAISTGAPASDDADFCTQVEDFFEAIPSVFRKKLDIIFMSPENELKYRRGKRKKYGKDFNFVTNTGVSALLTLEDFPGIQVKGFESHAGSDLMWTSIPMNRIRALKKASLANTMLVKEYAPRTVSAYTDWFEALNFEVPEFVFHNDQDLE
ncbi:hypothetical protein [Sediminibacterium sp.]|uniref:hypothetical protein n=1 Tax=Sediminibacterium sp. TaxID=1917865 RepID=UPI003F696627